MAKRSRILFICLLSCVISFTSCRNISTGNTFDHQIHAWLATHADSLETMTDSLLQLSNRKVGEASLQQAFTGCRKYYKQLEWFSEYYAPATARMLNGPPLPEIETEEHRITAPPSGLQVIEALLYPYDSANTIELVKEIRSFKSAVIGLRDAIENMHFDTAHVFEACKLEVFRVAALGISGFDTPLCGLGIKESATSLEAVMKICMMTGIPDSLQQRFNHAIAIGRQSQHPHNFDYAAFITAQLNPLTTVMMQWYQQEKLPLVKDQTALRNDARTLFDTSLLNIRYFVHAPDAIPTPEMTTLGKELFENAQLSGNGKRSCQSCHQPDKAFTDGMNQPLTLSGGARLLRNTPTLLYAGFQHAQFYDMRSPTLENQALDVLSNKDEMHSSPQKVAAWLNTMPGMPECFRRVFPGMQDSIRSRQVITAIAGYIRSLQPFRSAFDKYMQGNTTAMSTQEVKGFNLFMGKGRCATCHFVPLFNGTAAPAFSNTESEVLGVLQQPGKPILDKDQGRYIHTEMEELKYAFKIPTLRNIALTAPYMHNGAYSTLEEVMEFYNKGGAAGYGIHLPNQTLAPDPLQLSQDEIKALVAFMHTLTDDNLQKGL
ncbi:MAG TPA: cytochrome c peroxidase [Chitinophaga sp.]|uniref:cytochrome-c peroxidase n=1 Tax=Chitinophaga sp. TaxID=1869181 RepID=UPI002B795100|nr:cytochrome c peroxidase [Chitinophaga sp.]HVI43998.1 cytochrome c peroxidase [Chitinophaga sp.]